ANSVITRVTDALASTLQVTSADLEVRLLQPLPENLIPGDATRGSVRLEPRLPSTVQPGRVSVMLRVLVDEQPIRTCPLAFEVAVFRDAAVATQLVVRGDTFSHQNVVSERVRRTGPQTPVSLRDVVGRQAQRALGSG